MVGKFTQKGKDVLTQAQRLATSYGHGFIGTEHILLGLVKVRESVAYKILTDKGVKFENIESKVLELNPKVDTKGKFPQSYTPKSKKIIEQSLAETLKQGNTYIGSEHLLLALINETGSIGYRILADENVDINGIKQSIGLMFNGVQKNNVNLFPMGKKIGNESKSKTPTLDKYSRNFTLIAETDGFDPIVGRDKDIERLIQILSRRTKNNPVLIGEPGVGKTAIVEGLAQKIHLGLVPELLKGKKVVALDLSSMVAGSKYRGEFEERIKKTLDEIMAEKNIILFIDELHTIIGAGSAEGSLDTANILKPALSRGDIQIIGATTLNEYRKHIEKDAALVRRFQQILIEEPTEESAIEMLKILRESYELHHNVTITDEGIAAAVNLSIRYIQDRFLPDKAIDIIDEAASKVKLQAYTTPPNIKALEDEIAELEIEKEVAVKSEQYQNAGNIKEEQEKLKKKLDKALKKWNKSWENSSNVVDEYVVAEVIAAWTGIPVTSIKKEDAKKLMDMEATLHKRVIGQNEAVTAISKAIRRGRVGLKDPKRPIGSFLFLGPTGVGKTELSKSLAEVLFDDESSIIRVDMSEYMEKHSVSKFIGSPPGYVGYDEGGQLSEKIRLKPYSVLLIDEIEKAHPDIFNILLQILDDGHITDSQGRKVDFKNTVIIMTSNVGGKNIVEPKNLGFSVNNDIKKDYKKMKSQVLDEVKKLFKPEFINRIDEMVVFHPLSLEDVSKISKILLDDLVTRINNNLNIDLEYKESVIKFISEKGYSPIYGARPLKRCIQNLVEDVLAEKILSDIFVTNDKILIDVEDGALVYTKK